MIETLIAVDDPRRKSVPENLDRLKNIDLIWMLVHALKVPEAPMWVGYNSLIIRDNCPKQQIAYLTPINVSPTATNVVLETMKQSQKIAEECNATYMPVTYDLAIAKVAMQLQSTEKL
ncbi:hypothetical protein RF55_24485 [Lasius niger]|uniref:Uncharacterized protein n=1 Tax=Lasius niger TaxID=67767 RepID=A0A0J7JUS8_LASNI|nr:hypothetical protein RF55_24485 [Lasius niger]